MVVGPVWDPFPRCFRSLSYSRNRDGTVSLEEDAWVQSGDPAWLTRNIIPGGQDGTGEGASTDGEGDSELLLEYLFPS